MPVAKTSAIASRKRPDRSSGAGKSDDSSTIKPPESKSARKTTQIAPVKSEPVDTTKTPMTTTMSLESIVPSGELSSEKSVFYAEEWSAVADENNIVDDFVEVHQFRSTTQAVRDLLESSWKLRFATSTTKLTTSSEDKRQERTKLAALFLRLKRLNRQGQFRLKVVRDRTAEHKVKLDVRHLELENLRYEVLHLRAEVERCLSFRSRDESVELLSVDRFFAECPNAVASLREDPHALQLARLGWELELRLRLAQELADAQNEVAVTRDQLTESVTKLDSLLPLLNAIETAASPAQEQLGITVQRDARLHRLALLLPAPLFVLFREVSAYAQALDSSLQVDIEGDAEEARVLAASGLFDGGPSPMICDDDLLDELDEDEDEEEEDYDETKSSKNKHKIKSQRGRKNKKRTERERDFAGAEVVATTERREYSSSSLNDNGPEKCHRHLLKVHPLQVTLHLTLLRSATMAGAKLHLHCAYLPQLHIVTTRVKLDLPADSALVVSISGGDLTNSMSLLSHLYLSDAGLDSPNPANQHLLKRAGLNLFDHAENIGLAYAWLQRLAGLCFLEDGVGAAATSISMKQSVRLPQPIADSKVAFGFVAECLGRVKRRVASRLALQLQLSAIESSKCSWCSDQLVPVVAALFPSRPPNTCLQAWRRDVFDDLAQLPQAASFFREGLVSEADACYVAELHHNASLSKFRGILRVLVPVDYPRRAPLLLVEIVEALWLSADRMPLTNRNSLHVKLIETEVNSYWQELCPLETESAAQDQLLRAQIHRLLVCLDAWAEQQCAASLTATAASAGGLEASAASTAGNVRCLRQAKFPTRAPALKYLPELDMFAQR